MNSISSLLLFLPKINVKEALLPSEIIQSKTHEPLVLSAILIINQKNNICLEYFLPASRSYVFAKATHIEQSAQSILKRLTNGAVHPGRNKKTAFIKDGLKY
ncbi:MAG: hypothetical protein J7502_01305 [Flavisolibacter sp.]|nr:hypothetical protein [Flavisolibacter sp.]